jgi:hypothetical protein
MALLLVPHIPHFWSPLPAMRVTARAAPGTGTRTCLQGRRGWCAPQGQPLRWSPQGRQARPAAPRATVAPPPGTGARRDQRRLLTSAVTSGGAPVLAGKGQQRPEERSPAPPVEHRQLVISCPTEEEHIRERVSCHKDTVKVL